ncbi:HAD family hydrolase [Hyphococcus sp. DH-69]|uniref:sulfotransferase-like domain-containing protein n=1 Tax=Hyphococcus formosus TaxID=3143534 RepID=UPI00398A5435
MGAANNRITMLSGPRNISTTMMRSFESRPDTKVVDEPFYAAYLRSSGADHPMRDEILRDQSNDWTIVMEELQKNTTQYVFEKHIAFHFTYAPSLDWLDGTRMFHLIRDPVSMVASYKNKLDDVAPIIESYRIQREIYERSPAPIVDATDILKQPDGMLPKLCNALEIEYFDSMLSWPLGARETDGIWGAHWYDAVNASTSFLPFTEKDIVLSPDLAKFAQACMEDYNFFRERRILP